MRTMIYNPFTGVKRKEQDVRTDPYGVLIWDGSEPLRAATRAEVEAVDPREKDMSKQFEPGWKVGLMVPLRLLGPGLRHK